MKIAIDFDDTLVNTKELVKKYMDKYQIKEFKNKTDMLKFQKKHATNIIRELSFFENAKEVMNRLSDSNELYIITARNNYYVPNMENLILDFIKKHNLPIKQTYFDCYKEGKADKCVELGIDIFIDDLMENCLAVFNRGIKVIAFNNNIDGITNAKNWIELEREVNNGRKSNY